MFGAFKHATSVSRISAQWAKTTSIDPGDRGQVTKKAIQYVKNVGMPPADAWLIALVGWMEGVPWPESKRIIAGGILQFLDEVGSELQLAPKVAAGARQSAKQALHTNP